MWDFLANVDNMNTYPSAINLCTANKTLSWSLESHVHNHTDLLGYSAIKPLFFSSDFVCEKI